MGEESAGALQKDGRRTVVVVVVVVIGRVLVIINWPGHPNFPSIVSFQRKENREMLCQLVQVQHTNT